jgi:hypothetical protein
LWSIRREANASSTSPLRPSRSLSNARLRGTGTTLPMGEVMVGQVEANNRLQRTALRAAAEPER